MNSELKRFLVVGTLTVLVDFCFYRGAVFVAEDHVALSKAFGFVAGTVFSYFANKYWTFSGKDQRSGSWWRFALLYASTLAINVGVNAAALAVLGSSQLAVVTAFLVATGTSATLNFLGMKFFVFQARLVTI